jgi:hypothetical protein
VIPLTARISLLFSWEEALCPITRFATLAERDYHRGAWSCVWLTNL